VRIKRFVRRFALYNFGMEKMAQGVYRRVHRRLVAGTWSGSSPEAADLRANEAILAEIVDTARARGIDVVFLAPHKGDLGPYGELIGAIADRTGLPFVVMDKVFARYPDDKTFYLVEHGHPNAFGHGLIARELFDVLVARRTVSAAR